MKSQPWFSVLAMASFVAGLSLSSPSAQAFTFAAQEVEQDRFVAVAVPLSQSDHFNLLILEQISTSQPCWQEIEGGGIDPLLLQFDFTGICGRSTDSNGYSIRIGEEDLGVNYRFSLVRRGDHLVLMGTPVRDRSAPVLEIGRTQPLRDGFLKIELNPEWRFAKRSYEGKVLGHIYLTRETYPAVIDPLPVAVATPPAPRSTPAESASVSASVTESLTPEDAAPAAPAPLTTAIEIPVPDLETAAPALSSATEIPVPEAGTQDTPPASSTPVTASAPPAPRATPSPPAPRATPSPAALPPGAFEIPVPQIPGASPPASAATDSQPISQPISIPVPEPAAPARPPLANLPPEPPVVASGSDTPNLPILSPNVLPVPSGEIPLGRAENEPDVYNGNGIIALNPSPTTAQGAPPPLVMPRYRVLANAANAEQQAAVRALVPDAFRSSYRGQTLLQVGAFRDRAKADEMVQLLSQRGIDTIVADN